MTKTVPLLIVPTVRAVQLGCEIIFWSWIIVGQAVDIADPFAALISHCRHET